MNHFKIIAKIVVNIMNIVNIIVVSCVHCDPYGTKIVYFPCYRKQLEKG